MTKRSADERHHYILSCRIRFIEKTKTGRERLASKKFTLVTEPGRPVSIELEPALAPAPWPPPGTGQNLACQPSPAAHNEKAKRGRMIYLTDREWQVWQRYGGLDKVVAMVAPEGFCIQCAESFAVSSTYRGWYCEDCHRDLVDMGQLPMEHATS